MYKNRIKLFPVPESMESRFAKKTFNKMFFIDIDHHAKKSAFNITNSKHTAQTVYVDNLVNTFLAHLSQRLTGELIVYPCSGVRQSFVRPSVVQGARTSSSPKQLGQSKPNFMWSLLGRGKESLFAASGSHDQDGRHAHIW